MAKLKTRKEYAELYLDPRWQRRRLEIMNRDQFSCCVCGSETETLNVHHSYYVKGRPPWAYPDFALRTLCKPCHKDEHEINESEERMEIWEEVSDVFLLGNQEHGEIAASYLFSEFKDAMKLGIKPYLIVEAAARGITELRVNAVFPKK